MHGYLLVDVFVVSVHPNQTDPERYSKNLSNWNDVYNDIRSTSIDMLDKPIPNHDKPYIYVNHISHQMVFDIQYISQQRHMIYLFVAVVVQGYVLFVVI